MTYLKGLDLSHWQGHIDFEAIVKAGYVFVFIKLTEGTTVIDPNGIANIKGAQKAGLMVGGYHFFRGSSKEANHFRSIAKELDLDYAILDSEDTSLKGDLTDVSLDFLTNVADLGKSVFYSNPSYIKSHYNKAITKYPLWIAHYGVDKPDVQLWTNWSAWQYNDKGRVPGVDGDVDLNYMVDSFAVKKVSKPKPAPKPSSGGIYIVKEGDNLTKIANNLGVYWADIAKLNGIKSPYTIYPKQKLKVPAGGKSTTKTYKIKSGDTFWGLETQHKWAHGTLTKLNPSLNPKVLQIGQVIKIPN